ncbi:hypothetical protein ACFVVX_08520 [Kitasatospora sp. NPDC058170]|uniref:hypothetical protein n=1 Tax=Kitasatospora sp. NPDC058170 TaxID=3346364 RepID=UPI0036D8090C
MDLLTYKELDTGPDAPEHPGWAHRAWHGLLSVGPTTVLFLLALSLGLGMAAAQITLLPVLVVFSIVWAVTLVALIGVIARWVTPGRGRHRVAA